MQADLRLYWSHIPHYWKSNATAQSVCLNLWLPNVVSSEALSTDDFDQEKDVYANTSNTQQLGSDMVPLHWSELELSDDNDLRGLALNHPTFLVKSVTPKTNINDYDLDKDCHGPRSSSYLGIGINPQGHSEVQGQSAGSRSRSSIDNYISLISSEDEAMDVIERKLEPREQRVLSVSSEDSDFGEPAKNEREADNELVSERVVDKEVLKCRNTAPSSSPICRIQNYYSLSFNP